jgi:magnesium chelatase subunit D
MTEEAAAELPFSAIVGQSGLRAALVLAVVDPLIGGVLVRGEPGTGKSSAVRAVRALLPELSMVDGCAFNCDPADAASGCAGCRARLASGPLPVRHRPVPLVTLPIGATEDRLLGTLDLTAATREGRAELSPGLLAAAHRGLLYIDEVNLAADHLLDALLDAAASGIHRVERDGVSAWHPARFALVATMNPTEGELRPQIRDRFGLCADAMVVRDPRERAEVLTRRLALERDPPAGLRFRAADRALAGRVAAARARLGGVVCAPGLIERIARLAAGAGVASHRADLVVVRAAIANAALAGRTAVEPSDVALAARLALAHRVSDMDQLVAAVAAHLLGADLPGDLEQLIFGPGQPWPGLLGGPGDGVDHQAGSGPADGAGPATSGGRANGHTTRMSTVDSAPAVAVSVPGGPSFDRALPSARLNDGPVLLDPRTDDLLAAVRPARSGGDLLAWAEGRDGGRPGAPGRPGGTMLAMAETVRAAARRRVAANRPSTAGLGRMAGRSGPKGRPEPLRLEAADLVRRRRAGRPDLLLLAVVDASWSMALDGVFARARAYTMGLLTSTRRGDRAAVVVVGGARATVAVPLSRYPAAAAGTVAALRARGRTPLTDGLAVALDIAARRWHYAGTARPVLIVVTDGRDNLRTTDDADLADLADRARRLGVTGVIVTPEPTLPPTAGPAAPSGQAAGDDAATGDGRALADRLGWRFRTVGG